MQVDKKHEYSSDQENQSKIKTDEYPENIDQKIPIPNNQQQIKAKKLLIGESQIKVSPYFQQYKNNFIRGRKAKNFHQYKNQFLLHDIICIKQSPKHQLIFSQKLAESRNYRIIHYDIRIGHFGLKIKIINISNQDNIALGFQKQINRGMFGTVYEAKDVKKPSAIKEIRLGNNPLSTIQQAIREYGIMKLLSAMECGPALNKIFGFDLVINEKCIYFESQKCQCIEEYLKSIPNQSQFLKDFKNLELQLIQMHSLNICHNDIKPCNIMYSPTLAKLVFIDFGFSEVKTEPLGFMKKEKAKGSYFYSCQDMKNLFMGSKDKDYVDMYFNDCYGLMKSKQTILSMIETRKSEINKQQISGLKFDQQFFFEQNQNLQIFSDIINESTSSYEGILSKNGNNPKSKVIGETDYFVLFITSLLSESKMDEIQSLIQKDKYVKKLLQLNFRKYYWVFLQIQVNVSIQNTYRKLKSIILKDSQISYQTKLTLETILDPYFQKALKGDLQTNQPYVNYMKQQQINKNIFKQKFNIFPSPQQRQVRFDNFSKKSLYSFVYQLPQQIQELSKDLVLSRKQQISIIKILPNQTQNLIGSFKISQLSQKDRQKILQHLSNSKDQIFKYILSIIQKLKISKSQQKSFRHHIETFLECFRLAGIQIYYQDLDDENFSDKQYFLACFNIIIESFFEFMKKFNIEKNILFITSKLEKQDNKLFDIFKTHISNLNPQVDANQWQINLRKDWQKFNYATLINFQKCLLIFFKLQPIFFGMNSYIYSKTKIDSLVDNLFQKLAQTAQYHFILSAQFKNSTICFILNMLFYQLMVFIYEIGINLFSKAESQDDIERLQFYYCRIFNFDQIFKKLPCHFQFALKIMKSHSVFYFTKDLCCLLIYRSTLPHSLYEKYQIIEKTQKFIEILNTKLYQAESQHIKILKINLFWQHFNQLRNQKQYKRLLLNIDDMFVESQLVCDQDMIRIFKNVYQMVNNNRKMNQAQKKVSNYLFDSFAYNNDSSPNQLIKRFKIPIKEFQLKTDPFKDNKINEINKNNESKIILQEINCLLDMQQNQISFFKKWYCIRQLMIRSLLAYPNQDVNLSYFVQKCIDLLQEFQSFQQRKIQIFRNLPLNISVSKFLVNKITNPKYKRDFTFKTVEKQDQNQFWLEIQRQSILQQYYYLLFLLFSNQNDIKDKNIIFNTWEKFRIKIHRLFQGKQNESLSYLELLCMMNQFTHNVKLKIQSQNEDNSFDQEVKQAQNNLLNSLQRYLNEMTQKNHQFAYNMKTSKYFMDLLLKIQSGDLKLKNCSKFQAKQRLIELFYYLFDHNQVHNFFTENKIYGQFFESIVRFGVQELIQSYQFSITKRKKPDIKELSSSQQQKKVQKQQTFEQQGQIFKNNTNNEVKHKGIIQLLLLEVGQFATKYPCSNYSQKIMRLAFGISKHLCETFINKQLLDYQQQLKRIQIVITQLLENRIMKLIKIKEFNELVILYLILLKQLLNSFRSNKVMNSIKSGHTQKTKNHHYHLTYNNKNRYAPFNDMLKKTVYNLKGVSLHKVQYSSRVYSIQLINQILLQTTFRYQNKYFYYSLKYFRSFRNTQLDKQDDIKYLPKYKMYQTQLINHGLKCFQKKFRKQLFSLVIQKSKFNNNNKSKCIFLSKIRQKIIDRLLISAISNCPIE